MLEFMSDFGTPSLAQMALLFADVSIPDISGGETQHGDAGVPPDPKDPRDSHAEDPTTQALHPKQLLLIGKYIFF
jgi:hypothetical protein